MVNQCTDGERFLSVFSLLFSYCLYISQVNYVLTINILGNRDPVNLELTVELKLYTFKTARNRGRSFDPIPQYTYSWSLNQPFPQLVIPLRGLFVDMVFNPEFFNPDPVPQHVGPDSNIVIGADDWAHIMECIREEYVELYS